VEDGRTLLRKLWRFSRAGFTVHAHANGDAIKGMVVALLSELVALSGGNRPVLTFHAGAIQRYFPRDRARGLTPLLWLVFLIPRKIICNNEAVKVRIQGYGVPASKIAVIPAFCREYLEYTPATLPSDLDSFLSRHRNVVFTYVRMRPLFYPATLIEGFAQLAARRPDVGLVICGGDSHAERELIDDVQARIQRHRIADRICFVEDLDHDAFLTVLTRSTLYLRTPITDGVASSVLESLALGVPVVACENGTRPRGVITYPATDPAAMAAAVEDTIVRRDAIVATLAAEPLPDTLSDEVAILTR
jgi:glycosyltransferase involved in cell wall biosynthesis